MANLRIGELARRTDTSAETLRFYESEGLIPPPGRSEAGYRLYSENDERRVHFIRRARAMGFSLKDIQELLSLQVERKSSTCGEVKELAEMKLIEIDQKIAELKKMKSALKQVTEACAGGDESAVHCTILDALEN